MLTAESPFSPHVLQTPGRCHLLASSPVTHSFPFIQQALFLPASCLSSDGVNTRHLGTLRFSQEEGKALWASLTSSQLMPGDYI